MNPHDVTRARLARMYHTIHIFTEMTLRETNASGQELLHDPKVLAAYMGGESVCNAGDSGLKLRAKRPMIAECETSIRGHEHERC